MSLVLGGKCESSCHLAAIQVKDLHRIQVHFLGEFNGKQSLRGIGIRRGI